MKKDKNNHKFSSIIAIGSNLGNRAINICKAIKLIEQELGHIERISTFFETKPAGGKAQEFFLNGAVLLQTRQNPEEQMTNLLSIENRLGRKREVHWGDRTIDLDIITIEENLNDKKKPIIFNSDILTCPHPRLEDRDFVLVPVAEIHPKGMYKPLEVTFIELLNDKKYALTGTPYDIKSQLKTFNHR